MLRLQQLLPSHSCAIAPQMTWKQNNKRWSNQLRLALHLLPRTCPDIWLTCWTELYARAAGQQQQQPDPFKHIADEYRQIRAGKTQAKLMDPAELPRRQKGLRRVDEGFWRQSTSSYAAPAAANKRRRQTLEKAPRKAIRVAKPGRQAKNLS